MVVENPSTDSIEARAASAMVETMHIEMLDRDEDDDDDDDDMAVYYFSKIVDSV